MKIDVNKNSYSFIFAGIVVSIVTILLSTASIVLKDRQLANTQKEKKQSILSTIGMKVSREEAEQLFSKYIKNQLVLNSRGNEEKGISAFDVDLSVELRKPEINQKFPIYLTDVNDKDYYIIPLRGDGLWDAIWGYIALEHDANTIKGVFFDHKSETPGLGAEITTEHFQNQFIGKKIFDNKGDFVSISVVKGGVKVLPKEKQIYAVDGISGSTITSDGVSNMINMRISKYLPYLKKIRENSSQKESIEEQEVIKK